MVFSQKIIVVFSLFIFCFSCMERENPAPLVEPTDPDIYDLSAWDTIGPGIHSGFASIDIAYPLNLPPLGLLSNSLKLSGWKGERVNCKILVWSAQDQEKISIQFKSLSNGDYCIDKESLTVSVIKYVLTDQFLNENNSSCGPRDNDKVPAHLSPDLLSKDQSFSIHGRGSRPIWISINIPVDAPSGDYTGIVAVKSGKAQVNHPLTLEVIDKTLPDPPEWSFHLDLWQNPFAVARFHHVKLWSDEHFKLLQPLLVMLAEAGQKCITTTIIETPWGDNKPCYDDYGSMIMWIKQKDGSWLYDYTIFDQYVSLSMKCGIKKQINCYSMVPVDNKFTWYDESDAQTKVQEFIAGTKKYEEHWKPFLLDFRNHLADKGWLDIATLALDEREEEEMTRLFDFLDRIAPEFKIAMAGFYYKDINLSIFDFSSNWRDNGRIPDQEIKNRKDAGFITTYYVACGIPRPNNFTFSPPAESCFEGWLAAAMGFDGFLRWAYNSWPENPLIDSRYIKWPAGDTYFIYPGPLSSVRFERLREGIQDYEKIRIIREELLKNNTSASLSSLEELNDFLLKINPKTLDSYSSEEMVNQGKRLLNEISKASL